MLLVGLIALSPAAIAAQSLNVYVDGEGLHLSSSSLRLLSNSARQQLRNGVTVTYAFRVGVRLSRDGEIRNSFSYQCVFSYDLWEEKFKVVRREPRYRSASHLTQNAAEQLCLEGLVVPIAILPADMPFWIALDYQMEDQHGSDERSATRSLPGLLVDIFSRRSSEPDSADKMEGGPFRLSSLRKTK